MTDEIVLRPARRSDLNQIVGIYNHYVKHTHITFDVEPIAVCDREKWFDDFADHQRFRLFVAEKQDGLSGYAHARSFRPKAAYATSVETTIYLAPDVFGHGIGTRLYGKLLEALEGIDVHRAYGMIALPNEASIRLHLKLGFEPLFVLSEVGRKFGRYYDVQWFEKKF